MALRQSHKWQEAAIVSCPYCHKESTYDDVDEKGDIMNCHHCGKQFQLGEQK